MPIFCDYSSSIRRNENFEKTRTVDLQEIKLPPSIHRSKKSVRKPETCLIKPRKKKSSIFESNYVPEIRKILKTWIPEIEVYEPVYEDDLPKGNDEKKRQSPTDEASEELANMNESAKLKLKRTNKPELKINIRHSLVTKSLQGWTSSTKQWNVTI